METKKSLYQPPVPSTSFDGDTGLCGDVLRFQYSRDGVQYHSGIQFSGVAATRTRAERCCQAWQIEGAYDTLVVVDRSAWVEEIRADTNVMWRDRWEMHHYMIYLEGGCFEVIAESWKALPETCTTD